MPCGELRAYLNNRRWRLQKFITCPRIDGVLPRVSDRIIAPQSSSVPIGPTGATLLLGVLLNSKPGLKVLSG